MTINQRRYSDLLKDPRWQKLRLKVFERDGWACKLCGNDSSTLHVHHSKYAEKPWASKMQDLDTVCEDCHKIVTAGICLAKKFCPNYIPSFDELALLFSIARRIGCDPIGTLLVIVDLMQKIDTDPDGIFDKLKSRLKS